MAHQLETWGMGRLNSSFTARIRVRAGVFLLLSLLLVLSLAVLGPKMYAGTLAVESKTSKLIVIDDSIADSEALEAGLDRGPQTDIVHLSKGHHKLADLARIVSQYRNLDSLHIISHGQQGTLQDRRRRSGHS